MLIVPSFRIALLMTGAALSLSACQTTQSSGKMGHNDALNASQQASTATEAKDSLPVIESMYKRNSEDPDIARRYAKALRENGRAQRAHIVLTPFAEKTKDARVLSEYSAVQSAMGNYGEAEKYARRAVSAAPESGEAHQVLGVALEAQSKHEPAEVSFRKALEHWQGNPTPVLNNLGLNLAAQGFLDEAVDTLRRASALSPERSEIERNLRIVTALQQQNPALANAANVPVPDKKPQAN